MPSLSGQWCPPSLAIDLHEGVGGMVQQLFERTGIVLVQPMFATMVTPCSNVLQLGVGMLQLCTG
eukprot:6311-Heterocapsa_arctica.AAC.1